MAVGETLIAETRRENAPDFGDERAVEKNGESGKGRSLSQNTKCQKGRTWQSRQYPLIGGRLQLHQVRYGWNGRAFSMPSSDDQDGTCHGCSPDGSSSTKRAAIADVGTRQLSFRPNRRYRLRAILS